jgi:uncharacterized protein (DUF433 family)
MLKIKVNEKSDYILSKQKIKNISVLECIAVLDATIEILRKDFKLSNENIKDTLKYYKDNLKEVK